MKTLGRQFQRQIVTIFYKGDMQNRPEMEQSLPMNSNCWEVVLNVVVHHRTKMFVFHIFQQIQYVHL